MNRPTGALPMTSPVEALVALRVQQWLVDEHDLLVPVQDIEAAMRQPLCDDPETEAALSAAGQGEGWFPAEQLPEYTPAIGFWMPQFPEAGQRSDQDNYAVVRLMDGVWMSEKERRDPPAFCRLLDLPPHGVGSNVSYHRESDK